MTEEQDASTIDPRVAESRIMQRIHEEMKDAWRHDDRLLEKFFPISPADKHKYQAVKTRNYSKSKRNPRWRIPATPKTASVLYTPLRMLLNDILYSYGIEPSNRLVLATHARSKSVHSYPATTISPCLFLAGSGNEFANIFTLGPTAATPSGISPIEVILDSDDLDHARDRLAVNISQIFQNQENRRFAYGLIITETLLRVYMFDHSGAVVSPPCNYHKYPEQFCSVISGLGSNESERLGFDASIFSDGPYARLRLFVSTEDGSYKSSLYTLQGNIFQFPSLVGRGTICWLASAPDGSAFVIKDAWIASEKLAGRQSEGILLRHAQDSGVVLGIAQVYHFGEVRRGKDLSELDTILHNRHAEDLLTGETKLDRVHTRIVLATYGKTLDNFTTRQELLFAFHDAVLAHCTLHNVAGILHRDISIHNILINPEGAEGNRGILIDFDHAIRVCDSSPYSKKTGIGTWRFMSRNTLKSEGPHTFLDDLESFYYVWCWILATHEKPGVQKPELPQLISIWDEAESAIYKTGLLLSKFNLPVAPWFGQSLHALAVRLHDFFEFRLSHFDEPSHTPDPVRDYDEFLGHIRKAIIDLAMEFPPAGDAQVPEGVAAQALERGQSLFPTQCSDMARDGSNTSSYPRRPGRTPAQRFRITAPPILRRSQRQKDARGLAQGMTK